MNEKAQRIKGLIQKSGKTYQELEKITGVKKSSLQRYASGVTTKIPLDVIEKLETAFDVPRGYIMGWDEKPAEDLEAMGSLAAQLLLDQDAMEMAQAYMQLSEVDRYAVRLVIASMASKEKTASAEAPAVDVLHVDVE